VRARHLVLGGEFTALGHGGQIGAIVGKDAFEGVAAAVYPIAAACLALGGRLTLTGFSTSWSNRS
jgi:hypothetical protein